MNTSGLRVLELFYGLFESLLDAGFSLRSTATKTSLKGLGRWRRNEDVASRDVGLLNLLDALHLDVEEDNSALLGLLLDGHLAGAVAVAAKLGVLDEAVLANQVFKLLHGHIVVVHAFLLAGARGSGSVRDGQAKGVWVALEEEVVEGAFADA